MSVKDFNRREIGEVSGICDKCGTNTFQGFDGTFVGNSDPAESGDYGDWLCCKCYQKSKQEFDQDLN